MSVIKILAIDDESTVQSILAAFLNRYLDEKGLKHEIKTLSDPVQGLFELSTNGDSYAVIILDVRLPKLTGDEIYNSLIHVNPELLNRVLFITGHPNDLTDRFAERTLNVLPKPFRYQNFIDKIEPILQLS